MNSNSLIHVNASYTIKHMHYNIYYYSKGRGIDFFITRHIIKNIPTPKNLFLREGLLIIKTKMDGVTLKDLSLSDKVKAIEARKYLLDNVSNTFGYDGYARINF